MSTLLDGRMARLEKKSGRNNLTPWVQIMLAGESPTPEEQQKIDDAGAKGFSVIEIAIVRSKKGEK